MKVRRAVVPALLVLFTVLVLRGVDSQAQSTVSRDPIDRITGKIREAFPAVHGAVVSLQGKQLILDVARKDGVQPGMVLTLYREGEVFRHPLTGVILGRAEDILGTVKVVDVQEGYSVAVPQKLVPGTVPKVGDQVRVSSSLIKVAVAPVAGPKGQNVDGETLGRELAQSLGRTGRFEVTDSDRFYVWLLERGIEPSQVLEEKNRQQIARHFGVDYLVAGTVGKVEERWVLKVKVLSLPGDETRVTEEALLPSVPFRVAGGSFPKRFASQPRVSPINPQFLQREQEQGIIGSVGLARSNMIDIAVRGMAVGDVVGDGKNEIVVIGADVVAIYRWDHKNLLPVATYNPGSGSNLLNVGVADINGNGIPEIFVTNRRNNLLQSFVLEYRGGALKVIQDRIYRYLRVVKIPGQKPELWAQEEGNYQAFSGKIYRYRWNGTRYVQGDPVPMPKDFASLGFNLYGFIPLDLEGKGKIEYVMVDNDDRLRVYARDGGLLWKSAEHYGGYENGFFIPDMGDQPADTTLGTDVAMRRVLIKGRILWGGKKGPLAGTLLMNTNIPSAGYVFENLRGYNQSIVSGLRWQAGGFYEQWRTRRLGGYMADYALADVDNDGVPDLVTAMVQPQGLIALRREGKSWIGVFKLSAGSP